MDEYYSRGEASNSDLSDLYKLLHTEAWDGGDSEQAYKMGTLVDCMITEPDKVNLYKRTCEGYHYSQDEIDLCRKMKASFYKDPSCKAYMAVSSFQKIFTGTPEFQFGSFKFTLPMRCKYDYFMDRLGYGGDIKSTAATTQKGFVDACEHFQYWRSRAVYMKLSGAKKDMLIGISKVNLKVFKIPITLNDKFYKKGLEEATDLALNYWHLFAGFNELITI